MASQRCFASRKTEWQCGLAVPRWVRLFGQAHWWDRLPFAENARQARFQRRVYDSYRCCATPHHLCCFDKRQLHITEAALSSFASDVKIHRNQTVAMQSVLLSMTRGYTFWCSGRIDSLKAEALVAKFAERYGILKSKLSLARRATRQSRTATKSGKTHPRQSASLVIHPLPGGHEMQWVLLATGPLDGEQMNNGSLPSQRLVWNDKYQLVQIPKKTGGVMWSWRLTRPHQRELEGWFVKAGRSDRQRELESLFGIARNYAMFAGVRAQVMKAQDRGVDIWNRQHPQEQVTAPPSLPVMVRQAAYDNPPMTLGAFVQAHKMAILKSYETMLSQYDDHGKKEEKAP